MADSTEDNKQAIEQLSADLDSMLDETEIEAQNAEQDSLLDDEDAIDRLLMDNAFDDVADEQDEFAEIDTPMEEPVSEEEVDNSDVDDEIDEFGDDADDLLAALNADDADDEAASEQANAEETENTTFEDPEDLEEPDGALLESEPELAEEVQNDDLMADFDISAEDEEVVEDEPEGERNVEQTSPSPPDQSYITESQFQAFQSDSGQQVNDLKNRVETLNLRISDVDLSDNLASLDENLSQLNTDLDKIRRQFKASEEKKPTLLYVTLILAVLALLVALGLGIIGWGADSKATVLSDSLISLEEDFEIITAKNNDKVIQALKEKLKAQNDKIEKLMAELNDFSQQMDVKPALPDEEKITQQLNKLNDQDMHIGDAIEALQQQITQLAENSRKTAGGRIRAAVKKTSWAVNLIAYTQQWYADRKAIEYEQKGVPVKVIKIIQKGTPWYQLRVTGFGRQYEAAAYAAKMKRILNLSSVEVVKE